MAQITAALSTLVLVSALTVEMLTAVTVAMPTVAMQQRLSVTNLSDLEPSPLVFGLFATHPTGPQRIALARDWARLHGVPVPTGLAR